MKDLFNSTEGFSSLSLKDLLEARDQYHYHLMNKKNVVATAIGYYRIRKDDTWPTPDNPHPDNSKNKDKPRTLENSEVRSYSWPAVLVFVDNWEKEKELSLLDPADLVPKTLFLADSRKVPVCVIEAAREINTEDEIDESKLNFPRNLISGGFPVITYTQQVKRIASFGCLVTDGHLTYALTNKHVSGEAGSAIYTKLAGRETLIGYGSSKSLSRAPFSKVYPDWPARNTYLNMDIGLIEVNDLNQWKTEVFNTGTLGRMADLSQGNISLNLIGQPVSGFGSISGKIKGEIKALFYRYKSAGGFEYVSDFLIGSRNNRPLNIHHGDSGTVLLYERSNQTKDGTAIRRTPVVELMPLALLWGQHILGGPGKKNKSPYALATCLSTACNLLGVDIVRDWNTDQPNIWGKTGHYTIGNFATEFITGDDNNPFKDLMKANLKNISFDVKDITPDWDAKDKATKEKYQKLFAEFCPLADVPDIIWKQSGKTTTWGRQGLENTNHYMDADLPCTAYNGNNYLQYCTDKSKVTVEEISNFYTNADLAKVKMSKAPNKGILPLRVWQAFDYMVDALKTAHPDIAKFIFAAGALAHYVGDGCQPLHSSYMSDGDPADSTTSMVPATRDSKHRDGTPSHIKGKSYPKTENPGAGVHAAYEDAMIDDNKDALIKGLKYILADPNADIKKEAIPAITDGQEAGYAIVELMRKTHETLAPADIVEAYKKYSQQDAPSGLLWGDFGDQTITCIARGCRYQAAIWTAAWQAAGKNAADFDVDFESDAFRKKLKDLYENPEELKSFQLGNIGPVLK